MPTSIPEPQWHLAASAIKAASSVLVVSHIFPDGDAVGSLLAISETLRAMGKRVTAAIDDGVPEELAFVPKSDTILAQLIEGEFDLMISVDASDLERIGLAGAYGLNHSQRVINLDHHATNTCYGNVHVIVPQAVAAAEVAYDLFAIMDVDVSEDIAYALLTGLVTDTQGFRISATNSRTLEIAQALMQKGAPLSRIMAQTLNRRPFEEVSLWARVLPSVQLKGGLISANITQQDLARAGLALMSDGGLVNHLVDVDLARVSVVFKELLHNQVEVSFRSMPGFDVASLAYQLGGGGHKQASGCTMTGSLGEVRDTVLPLAHQVVAEGIAALE